MSFLVHWDGIWVPWNVLNGTINIGQWIFLASFIGITGDTPLCLSTGDLEFPNNSKDHPFKNIQTLFGCENDIYIYTYTYVRVHVVQQERWTWQIYHCTASFGSWVSCWELTTNISFSQGRFEEDFLFPKVGYVSSCPGRVVSVVFFQASFSKSNCLSWTSGISAFLELQVPVQRTAPIFSKVHIGSSSWGRVVRCLGVRPGSNQS